MHLLGLMVAGGLLLSGVLSLGLPSPIPKKSALCSLMPGRTLAVVRVEKDTTLLFGPAGAQPMSSSSVRVGPSDSLLATPTTLMPAARVRLLKLDSITRALLSKDGVTDSQPVAFLRASPYRADCRTIRWIDSIPFVERGEIGFVRATLAPREYWIDGVPVLVISDAWYYPYPRRRGLAFRAAPDAKLASADAMFSFNVAVQMSDFDKEATRIVDASARRTSALAWARANPEAAELEPVRALVRQAVLELDWEAAEAVPSRLRGTYRVELEVGGTRKIWFFRTHDRPSYNWRGPDSLQTTAELIASPYIRGYRLVGHVAASLDSIPTKSPAGADRVPLVWLATNDRPTEPGNDARRALSGMLEFNLSATPELLWDDLEAFVPRQHPRDSAWAARTNRPIPRSMKQPQLPFTVRLDGQGGVRADTMLTKSGRAMRVAIERLDTISLRRPW